MLHCVFCHFRRLPRTLLSAAYATTTELAAAQAAGLTPTTYAMKNPTPNIM